MQITEREKLERDLKSLLHVRQVINDARTELEPGKRETPAWLRMHLTILIGAIDQRIGAKKKSIAWETATERIMKGAEQHDETGMGNPAAGETDDAAGDADAAAADGGRHEANGKHKHQRPDGAAGLRSQLGQLGADRGFSAGRDEGGGKHSPALSPSEILLRQRHRERNREALRDWQRRIMAADRAGRHERLEL